MDDEQADLHPLTKLMLARMESHPEEFPEEFRNTISGGRWVRALNAIQYYGSDTDKQALDTKLHAIWLDKAHEWAMDELLNGEERRKQNDLEVMLAQQKVSLMQQVMNAQAQVPFGQATATGVLGGSGGIPVSIGGGGGLSLASPSNTTTPSLLDRAKRKLGI